MLGAPQVGVLHIRSVAVEPIESHDGDSRGGGASNHPPRVEPLKVASPAPVHAQAVPRGARLRGVIGAIPIDRAGPFILGYERDRTVLKTHPSVGVFVVRLGPLHTG